MDVPQAACGEAGYLEFPGCKLSFPKTRTRLYTMLDGDCRTLRCVNLQPPTRYWLAPLPYRG